MNQTYGPFLRSAAKRRRSGSDLSDVGRFGRETDFRALLRLGVGGLRRARCVPVGRDVRFYLVAVGRVFERHTRWPCVSRRGIKVDRGVRVYVLVTVGR